MQPSELSCNWKELQSRLRTPGKKSNAGTRQGVSKQPKLRSSESLQRTGHKRALRKGHTISSSDDATASITQCPQDLINAGVSPSIVPGKYVALDCEMVGVGPPPYDRSMLARASIVDYNGTQLYDSFVLPKELVTDYRSAVSGITPALIAQGSGARPFEEVQRDISKLLEGRVLVGHAVGNDLRVLFLKHPASMTRDTSDLKKFREVAGGRRPRLKDLAKQILGLDIQAGSHSSIEDARVTMALFRKEKGLFEGSREGDTKMRAGVIGQVVGSTSSRFRRRAKKGS